MSDRQPHAAATTAGMPSAPQPLVAISGEVRSGEKAVLKPPADLQSGTLVKLAQK